MVKNCSGSAILSLPSELYGQIVEFCVSGPEQDGTSGQTLKRLRLVSWPFYHAATRLLFQQVTYLATAHDPISRDALDSIMSSDFAAAVHRLTVGAGYYCQVNKREEYDLQFPEIISGCLSRFENLQSIELVCLAFTLHKTPPWFEFCHHSMGESLLKALVNRPPRNLEHLRIVNFGISHDKLPLESLKPVIENLRSLSICSDVKQRGDATTESGLYSALRYARKLRELKIEGATDAPQTSFGHLLPEAPLRALDISGLFFTFYGICEISKFAKTLTTLCITHNWLTDGTWAEFIETLWDFPLLNNGLLGPNYYVKDTMTTAGQEVTDEQECHSFHKKKMTAREAWVSNDTLEY